MIVDQTRNRPSALAFAAATSPSIFAPADQTPRFPGWEVGVGRSERELVAVRQQHAARKNLGSVAHRWRARDRHAIADANWAPVYAAIPQNADRRRFGIPHGLHAFLVLHGQEDLSMRVAPRHGLDDAGDFDRLSRIEDTRLTVMRVSKAHEHVETKTKLTSRTNCRMLLSPVLVPRFLVGQLSIGGTSSRFERIEKRCRESNIMWEGCAEDSDPSGLES